MANLPVQELMDTAGRMLGDAADDVAEIHADAPISPSAFATLAWAAQSSAGRTRCCRPRLGLGIERDLWFKADKPILAYIEEASKRGRINA
jgi:hypothetical protein